MADESDFERTEAASARRLEQARLAGRVVRSTEVVSLALLLALSAAMIWLVPGVFSIMAKPLASALSFDHAEIFSLGWGLGDLLGSILVAGLWLVATTLLVVFATVAIGGFVFSPAAVHLDAERVSLTQGWSRLFSLATGFELLRVAVRLTLVLTVVVSVIFFSDPLPLALITATPEVIGIASDWAGRALLVLAGAMAVFTTIEIAARYWLYQRAERMTRAEVLQEYREAEGDPQLKAQIEARRRAWAEEHA